MADNTAGLASNLTMGESNGASKETVAKDAGVNQGIVGSRGDTGPDRIRDIPLLTRESP